MLFIAYGCHSKAVWNAIKLHVEFAKELNEPISFMVEEKYSHLVKSDYPHSKIYTYTSMLDLMFKLTKVEDESIFSPVMYTTLFSLLSKLVKAKKIYYWVQGSVPEESFLRNKSKSRYYLLSTIEYLALTISNKKIFVSPEMKNYLEKKFHKKFKNTVIVPCISEFTYDGSLKEKDSFVYIGGMSAWQRIDVMLEMFNEILEKNSNSRLYIATLEKEIAERLIQRHIHKKYHQNIELLTIENREEIARFLSTKEYGFLIREDIVVNHVSSPIKLAEYLSCGVNVIISEAVKSYAPIIDKNGAGIKVANHKDFMDSFTPFQHNKVAAIEVYKNYFSKEKHLMSYQKLLNQEETI
jgi:glycosyltransferase involved in cell wall biosynthesis